jgi:hypothetical protein
VRVSGSPLLPAEGYHKDACHHHRTAEPLDHGYLFLKDQLRGNHLYQNEAQTEKYRITDGERDKTQEDGIKDHGDGSGDTGGKKPQDGDIEALCTGGVLETDLARSQGSQSHYGNAYRHKYLKCGIHEASLVQEAQVVNGF